MLRQGANTGAVKSQFGKTVIAFFHKLNLFCIPLFFCIIRHQITPSFKSFVLNKACHIYTKKSIGFYYICCKFFCEKDKGKDKGTVLCPYPYNRTPPY